MAIAVAICKLQEAKFRDVIGWTGTCSNERTIWIGFTKKVTLLEVSRKLRVLKPAGIKAVPPWMVGFERRRRDTSGLISAPNLERSDRDATLLFGHSVSYNHALV